MVPCWVPPFGLDCENGNMPSTARQLLAPYVLGGRAVGVRANLACHTVLHHRMVSAWLLSASARAPRSSLAAGRLRALFQMTYEALRLRHSAPRSMP